MAPFGIIETLVHAAKLLTILRVDALIVADKVPPKWIGLAQSNAGEYKMKSAKDFMDEANAVVPRISAAEAVAKYNQGGSAVWIDVRDSADIAASGTIKGAERVPGGFMVFAADESMPFHKPFLTKDADINLICGAGGQAAIAGKILHDMGYTSVTNVGGFSDWKDAGGATEA
jgi:rhodanese-related sulfurtransferase